MAGLRRSIPALGALATFEAAARLGGFTLAAAELGVTQAAVSRTIKLLEQDLNVRLFLRAHRKVTLTEPGEQLAQAVFGAFARMAETIETIRQPVQPHTVRVGATVAFAHFWLLPRLPQFRAAYPWVNLRLVAEDAPTKPPHDRLDVILAYGTPPFAMATSVQSCAEEVFAVCSPAFAARHAAHLARHGIAGLPLIGLDWVDPSWMTWKSWAMAVGLGLTPGASGLSFNHYTDAISAAVNGEGIVLGWGTLLSDLLADGRLVRAGDKSIVPAEHYHVLLPGLRPPTAATRHFVAWLSDQFAAAGG